MGAAPRIRWKQNEERRFPFGRRSPDPEDLEPIGFPPPWEDRPWVCGTMVTSADGVVAWRRSGPGDDPVLAVLGGDDARPERLADRRHMRYLRCFGDVAIGAQTLREQPGLLQTPQPPGEPPAPELYRFRLAHGLPREPRHVVYSASGDIDLALPLFNTAGVEVIVITTASGAAALAARGATARGIDVIAHEVGTPEGMRRAHEELFAERGVRYLDCEGGATVLRALHGAGLLDELFVTVTDAVVDQPRHAGVQKLWDIAGAGARLVAEGRIAETSQWTFRRWRINER